MKVSEARTPGSRAERELVHERDREYTLRGSESRTLATVGAFRVVSSRDLRDHDGSPADPRSGDLRHLREQGLIEPVPPLDCGSVSVGTEPRRERPRFPPRSVTLRATQGSFTSRFRVSGSEREARVAACQIERRRAARSRTRGCVISSGRMSRNRAGMDASDRLCRWLPSRTLMSCMPRPSLAARLSGSNCPRHWPVRTARIGTRR